MNSDLYERYGDDIVFLFKGQEPFTENLGCPMGVLIERDNKVLCYECEDWFTELGPHLRREHKIVADDYKKKYGFNKTAPLCSQAESERKRSIAYAAIDDNPQLLEKAALGRKKAKLTLARYKYSGETKQMPPKRMQGLNSRNACPEQIKQRYKLLQAKYGNDVGLNTIRKVDPGVEAWGVRHYGSWNAFKEVLGESIDTSSKRKEAADLIYDLREYVAEYQKLPWNPYTKAAENGFPHSQTPYIRQWGKVTTALLACGIEGKYVKGVNSTQRSQKVFRATDVPESSYLKSIEDFQMRMAKRGIKIPTYVNELAV